MCYTSMDETCRVGLLRVDLDLLLFRNMIQVFIGKPVNGR